MMLLRLLLAFLPLSMTAQLDSTDVQQFSFDCGHRTFEARIPDEYAHFAKAWQFLPSNPDTAANRYHSSEGGMAYAYTDSLSGYSAIIAADAGCSGQLWTLFLWHEHTLLFVVKETITYPADGPLVPDVAWKFDSVEACFQNGQVAWAWKSDDYGPPISEAYRQGLTEEFVERWHVALLDLGWTVPH